MQTDRGRQTHAHDHTDSDAHTINYVTTEAARSLGALDSVEKVPQASVLAAKRPFKNSFTVVEEEEDKHVSVVKKKKSSDTEPMMF